MNSAGWVNQQSWTLANGFVEVPNRNYEHKY